MTNSTTPVSIVPSIYRISVGFTTSCNFRSGSEFSKTVVDLLGQRTGGGTKTAAVYVLGWAILFLILVAIPRRFGRGDERRRETPD